MKTQLYSYYGIPLFEVAVDESSSQDWSLMSDNKLSISFELEECVVLTAGCYIDFDGTRFYLLNEYKPTMIYSSVWKYDLTLGDAASWLSITLALKTIDGEDTPMFKYTGPAAEHAAIIVANLNRRMGTDQWKVGSVISTENIAIDYSGKYCSDVLQEIVDAKNTEWWIDGMTLNIGRAEFGESVTLGYMNGVLGDIVCDTAGDMRSYAYLFPIGSTRNIDPTKYGHDRLQLPSGLKSVPINPEQGVAELVEEAAFAHIFPRYEGTVSAVRYTTAKNENGTSFLIYYIQDSAIPFNPNEFEIPGLVKHITFQSGELMGQEFEVNYSADSNEFELITRWNGDIQLPGGVLTPAVGDKYVVWNVSMPDVYYPIASHEFLDAARVFAADAVKDVSVYKVKLDYIEVQERGLKLRPGQRVRLMSDEYFALGYYDSRITRITRNIAYPDELSVDISAVRVVGTLSRLQASIQKTENVVAQFSGQLPAIIKSDDDTSANNSSVYTSAKSEKEFLNKRKGGKVAAPITFDEVAEFLNGLVAHKYIKIGNGYLRYNDELGVWEMEGDLAVTGNVAWFASIKGFKPSTIMDAVQVDGATIVKTRNSQGQWQLTAIGGGSGTGGGLTAAEVNALIEAALVPYALKTAIPTDNNQLSNSAGYITASALSGLATEQYVTTRGYITSDALVGYATESWVTNKGYITSSALNGYATQSWVEGKKYLTGITSAQVTTALGYTPYNSSNPDKYIKGIDYDMVIAALGYTPYSATNPMGYLTTSSLLGYATEPWVTNALDGYATQSWVEGKKYLTGITSSQVTTALGYTPYNSSNPDKYIKGIDYDMVIAALGYTPYSNTNPMGYLTTSSLLGYATEQWVGDNYLSKSGGTINGSITANFFIGDFTSAGDLNLGANSILGKNGANALSCNSNHVVVGYGTSGNGWPTYIDGDNIYLRYGTNHSIGFALKSNGNILIDTTVDSGHKLQVNGDAIFTDAITAPSFIGNLAGNANSATIAYGLASTSSNLDANNLTYPFAWYYGQSNAGLINWPHGGYGVIFTLDAGGGIKGQLSWDFNHNSNNPTKNLYWRANCNIGWDSNWKTIAFTDSNVASATKLENTRTIWGQDFNGTWDIGNNGTSQWIFLNSGGEGIYISGSGINWHNSSNKLAKGLMGFNADGTVIVDNKLAVGGTSSDAMLHVHGDVKVTGHLGLTTGFDLGSVNAFLLSGNNIYVGSRWYNTVLRGYILDFVVGDATAMQISADGNTTINGNLLVNGNVSWVSQSQRSLKNIISEQGLSLAQMERIKPIKFYWKDRRDTVLHVGGIADDMQEVLPEVVQRGRDNTLRMNYVDAAFYIGASLIAPVLDHDRRIAQLERENAELKQKLNQLTA